MKGPSIGDDSVPPVRLTFGQKSQARSASSASGWTSPFFIARDRGRRFASPFLRFCALLAVDLDGPALPAELWAGPLPLPVYGTGAEALSSLSLLRLSAASNRNHHALSALSALLVATDDGYSGTPDTTRGGVGNPFRTASEEQSDRGGSMRGGGESWRRGVRRGVRGRAADATAA